MRWLARLHAGYLALVVLVPLIVAEPWHGSALFFSFAPLAVWYTLLSSGYRLTRNPLGALLVVAAVPLQVGYSVSVHGGGVIDFFHEEAVVALSGVLVGLVVATGWAWRSKVVHALVLAVFLLAPWIALNFHFLRSTQDWPLYGRLAFYSAALTSTAGSVLLFGRAAQRFRQGGEAQKVVLEYGANPGTKKDPEEQEANATHPTDESAAWVGLELDMPEEAAPLAAVGAWFVCFVIRGVIEVM
ncbi:MAG: hypothetical protein AAF928_10370 [Myxococcota bacterium]